jgi:hypothetical protein
MILRNITDTYEILRIPTKLLQNCYGCTTVIYRTADYKSLHITTVTTVTTGFVGKSHGLLMQAEPEPAQAYQHGSGFGFGRPRPRKAEPNRRLSGRASTLHSPT